MKNFKITNGRFRLLRKLATLTHVKLAESAGVSVATTRRSEREGESISGESLLKLLRSYNIDPNDADEDYFYTDPNDRLRPGKQRQRDRTFGIDDPEFWHWWHREGKKAHGRDMRPEDDPHGIYADWDADGRPLPKEIITAIKD